jgi:hypothetical protein
MIEPEDRVLVCVVNRKRDLRHLLDERWYRVPVEQMPDGIQAEILAFYVSKSIEFSAGAVRYYAVVRGVELTYRRWLLPEESTHPRADNVYYRVALAEIIPKNPPVFNPLSYRIHFIRTTWTCFSNSTNIQDFYQ